MMKKLLLTSLCLVFVSNFSAAQTCNLNVPRTKPNNQYELLNSDTEVKDKKTGLIWQRCVMGMSWNGATCTGSVIGYTWDDALAQAATLATNTGVAWRVPSVKELASLAESTCMSPPVNETLFPATPEAFFWTSTPFTSEFVTGAVWIQNAGGNFNWTGTYNSNLVRFVRGE